MPHLILFRTTAGTEAPVSSICRTDCVDVGEPCAECRPFWVAVEVQTTRTSAYEGVTDFEATRDGQPFDLTTVEGGRAVEMLNAELLEDEDWCAASTAAEQRALRDSYR